MSAGRRFPAAASGLSNVVPRDSDLERRLIGVLRASPAVMQVLAVARELALPDWRLFSGAVYQTVWNALTGRAPAYGIRDYDLGYFDPDVSLEAEDDVILRAAAAFPEALRGQVQVRNQARVHLWFEGKFGEPFTPLRATDEALGRFVAPAFAVGVRLEPDDAISIAAPFGLRDMFALRIRPNPDQPRANGWSRIVSGATSRWPELTVVEPALGYPEP